MRLSEVLSSPIWHAGLVDSGELLVLVELWKGKEVRFHVLVEDIRTEAEVGLTCSPAGRAGQVCGRSSTAILLL